jgi:hypothetical protein
VRDRVAVWSWTAWSDNMVVMRHSAVKIWSEEVAVTNGVEHRDRCCEPWSHLQRR